MPIMWIRNKDVKRICSIVTTNRYLTKHQPKFGCLNNFYRDPSWRSSFQILDEGNEQLKPLDKEKYM